MDIAPLALGFMLARDLLITGPITGQALNPARTLGPMLISGEFSAMWAQPSVP